MGRTGREMGEVGSPAVGDVEPGCRRCGARLSEVWSPAVGGVEPGCPKCGARLSGKGRNEYNSPQSDTESRRDHPAALCFFIRQKDIRTNF
nr:hypothetical protein [Bacteroides fragilis]